MWQVCESPEVLLFLGFFQFEEKVITDIPIEKCATYFKLLSTAPSYFSLNVIICIFNAM